MNSRELKALEIAARMRLTFKDGTWLVPSQSSNAVYNVVFKIDGASCTCEDWTLRPKDFKHIIAARLVAERAGDGKALTIDTDTLPVRKN